MVTNKILILCLVALAVGVVLYLLLSPLLTQSARANERRLAIVRGEAKKSNSSRDTEAVTRRKQVTDSLKDLEKRDKKSAQVTLEMKLEQAGLSITERSFIIASCVSGAVLGLLVLIILGPLWGLGGLLLGGLGLPNWILNYLRAKRIKDFLREFPVAIEVIIRGVKSGLPLAACLQTVAVQAREPVREEFQLIVASTSMGLTIAEGIERLAQRVPLPETNFFAIVVSIQQKAGGNLTEALGNLSQVLRDRITMELKVKALSSEAKSSAWIIGSLPVVISLLIYFVNPTYLEPLWTTETGQMALSGIAIWMSLGVFAMRQMVNFKP
jgi:tight adherence protein B